MKKFLVSIFAVFYLGLSCGFAFNIHFCMGKISSVDLLSVNSNKCNKCGMKRMKGCCDSKLTVVKITDSQQVSSTDIHTASPFHTIADHYVYISLHYVTRPVAVTLNNTSPPPIQGAFLCILNSVFII